MSSAAKLDVGTFFDERAHSYDATYDLTGWGGYVLRTRLEAVLEAVGDGPGEALDAGMGPGRLCESLQRRGWRVSGVDLSEEMVCSARRRLPWAAERLVRGTIGELPFADGSFDVVTATGVLEYAELVPQALQELGRVLRPGGRAVVSVPNTGSLHALSRSLTDPVARTVNRIRTGREPRLARRDRIPRLEGLEHLLRDAGLEVTDVRHVAALVIPAPLDGLLPGASQRLGRAFERRPRTRRRMATQVVITATKGRRK